MLQGIWRYSRHRPARYIVYIYILKKKKISREIQPHPWTPLRSSRCPRGSPPGWMEIGSGEKKRICDQRNPNKGVPKTGVVQTHVVVKVVEEDVHQEGLGAVCKGRRAAYWIALWTRTAHGIYCTVGCIASQLLTSCSG